MSQCQRIFIVGHPGAGKALVAKELAKKLGWQYIDANLDLEIKIGRSLIEILGQAGEQSFHDCQSEILIKQLTEKNIVVATDASIVCSLKNKQLLSSEFVVNLKVSTPIQLERTTHNPLLAVDDLKLFFDKLHKERDDLYNEVSRFSVDSDDSALEKHVLSIVKAVTGDSKNPIKESTLDAKKLIIFHKISHTPVHLSGKQADCLVLLADGKTSKEIADKMNLSYRTVEDYIAKITEILGCTSSKELIALYHDQP